MKLFLLVLLTIFVPHIALSAAVQAKQLIENPPAAVQQAGSNLDKFSGDLHDGLFYVLDLLKVLLKDPLVVLGHKQGGSSYLAKLNSAENPYILRFLLITALSCGALLFSRGMVRNFLQPKTRTKKDPSSRPADYRDQIFFRFLPWIVFIAVGASLCSLLGLPQVLGFMLNACFFTIATGYPLKEAAYFIARAEEGPAELSSLARYWFPYLIMSGLLTVLLLVFFGCIIPLGSSLSLASHHKALTLKSPSLFFGVKTVFYFYLANLFIFLVHLERSLRKQNSPSGAGSKDHAFLSSRLWYYFCDFLIVGSLILWLAYSFGWVGVKKAHYLFLASSALVLCTLRDFTHSTISYLAEKLSNAFFSRKVQVMFGINRLLAGVLSISYIFVCIVVGARLWYDPSLYQEIMKAVQKGSEKTVVVGIILAVTMVVKNSVLNFVDSLANAPTQEDLSNRSWGRFSTFLIMTRSVTPYFFWVPAFTIILNYCGIEGKHVLIGLGGVVALVVWLGQGIFQDAIKGISYVLGNVIVKGEPVSIDGVGGAVEYLNLHSVSIRDMEGFVHTFSYSKIKLITSTEWIYSKFQVVVTISYASDQEKALKLMEEALQKTRKDQVIGKYILEDSLQAHIKALRGRGVTLRGTVKIQPSQRLDISDAYFRHLKKAFDKHHIEMAPLDTSLDPL